MKPKLLVIHALGLNFIQQLEEHFELIRHDESSAPGKLIAQHGESIEAAITHSGIGFKNDWFVHLPNLKLIANTGVGLDSIDLDACATHGIQVTNTPDVLDDDVADLAIGLLISAFRNIHGGHEFVKKGRWTQGRAPLTRSLKNKTLGVVGLGRIGAAIAQRAEAFGMKILYHNRKRKSDVAYPYVDNVLALSEKSDALMLACPGGPETANLVDRAVLKALGPNGWVINIARGSVIDEDALFYALNNNLIAGAALDVFHNEPNIDERFLANPKVLLSPHNASATRETRYAMEALVTENLMEFAAGKPLRTPVLDDLL
ncbi:MAG TPA: 2-hydroxyacid dehydrogenase [Paenalcaligenes sp.]|nr:2-hydroxyacid dehydrogenase [Paenalcaligenes sp.]